MKFLILFAAVAVAVGRFRTEMESFLEAIGTFTGAITEEVFNAHQGRSTALSAFYLEPLLAQLSLGAEGSTQDQLRSVLGVPDDQFTRDVFPVVINDLENLGCVTLHVASSLFLNNRYRVNPQFGQHWFDVYHSDIKTVNFRKSVTASVFINTWVKRNTDNKIKTLVQPSDLNATSEIILANAIYFKGLWKKSFDPELTRYRTFFASRFVSTMVPTMKGQSQYMYGYSTKLKAKLLKLPYADENAQMIIVLPDEVDGLHRVINKLRDPRILQEEEEDMIFYTVDVLLPKFTIETKTDFKNVLINIGIDKIFNPREAQLENIVGGPITVSKVVQKAVIEVDEEGADDAGAHKGFQFLPLRYNLIKQFKADRPFAYYVKIRGFVFFSGTFTNN